MDAGALLNDKTTECVFFMCDSLLDLLVQRMVVFVDLRFLMHPNMNNKLRVA